MNMDVAAARYHIGMQMRRECGDFEGREGSLMGMLNREASRHGRIGDERLKGGDMSIISSQADAGLGTRHRGGSALTATVRSVPVHTGSERETARHLPSIRLSRPSATGLSVYGGNVSSIHSEYPDNASGVVGGRGWVRFREAVADAKRPEGIIDRMRDAVLGHAAPDVYDGSVRRIRHSLIPTQAQMSRMLAKHALWARSNGRLGRRLVLRDASLRGTSLAGAMLRGAIIADCDLSCCDLAGAVLRDASFEDCDMTRRNGMTMSASVSGSMRGCDMRGTKLIRCDMSVTEMTGSDMRGSVLVGCLLHGCDLSRACFAGAVLDGCDLTMTMMRGTIFGNSMARGCELDGVSSCGRMSARTDGLAGGKVTVSRPIAVWDVPMHVSRNGRPDGSTAGQRVREQDVPEARNGRVGTPPSRRMSGAVGDSFDEWDDLD